MIARSGVAAALAGLCLWTALAQADPPGKPLPNASVRDILYLGRGGPTRLCLHMTIAGRPVDAVWSEAVTALFTFCDRNGDGMLDAKELEPFSEPRRALAPAIDAQAGGQPLRLSFDRRDPKVTRAQFAQALQDAGYGPVSLTVTVVQPESAKLSAALFRRPAQATVLHLSS